MTPEPAADTDFPPTASRPASLWPDTAQQPQPAGAVFAPSRFDPLVEERARVAAEAAAAFDVCQPGLALRALLLVQAALAVAALAEAQHVLQWAQRQGSFAFAGVAGTLLWLVALCALKAPLRRAGSAGRVAGVLLLGAAAALAAWAPLAWAGLGGEPQALRITAVAVAGVALAALLWAWLDLRSRIWQPANAAARLAELQSRIRPHFLFNALNAALALVRVDPARAEGVLEDLSALFRTALVDAGSAVSLDEEIDLARRYLAIEQVRFGQRLQLAWELDPRAGAAQVPPLVLQPLVENAVRHGVEPLPQGARVTVRTQLQRGQVLISVTNTMGDEPGAPGHGMALHNVRERLRLLHDVAAQCDTWREPGVAGQPAVFHARVVVPAP